MTLSTATAPSNLAFVKYWGKKNSAIRIPCNSSISVNLSNAITTTTVEFVADLEQDRVIANQVEIPAESNFMRRVSKHLDRLRVLAGDHRHAIVTTENTFPESVGIASSASGFAALSVAAADALQLDLNEKELSKIARLGSGSACRSIHDGFVEWIAGEDHDSSFAQQIAPPDHWDLSIVTVIVSKEAKKLTSTKGHELALLTPYFKSRMEIIDERLDTVRNAILNKDFETFGRELEVEAVSFHTIAMTSPFVDADGGWNSGAYYWTQDTMELILAVQAWRASGLETYFTLDAGPSMHLICQRKDEANVISAVNEIMQRVPNRQWDMLINHPAIGGRVLDV